MFQTLAENCINTGKLTRRKNPTLLLDDASRYQVTPTRWWPAVYRKYHRSHVKFRQLH